MYSKLSKQFRRAMWGSAVWLSLVALAAMAQDAELRLDGPYPAREGETCVVCNSPTTAADIAYVVNGQRVAIKREMEAEFLAKPRTYLAAYRPENMLFSATTARGENWTMFALGSYVLAGVVFGALCAQLAMRRGRSSAQWFVYGFVGNAIAWAALRAQPAAETVPLPDGLRKVGTTSDPVGCPHCGRTNHPLATQCLQCEAALNPRGRSEASRELRGERHHG